MRGAATRLRQILYGLPALAVIGVLAAPQPAFATVQSLDSIRCDSRDCFIWCDYPLEYVWKDNHSRRPRFDEGSTANRKGYTAKWEIRDSKLWLVSFKAEIGGKPVEIGRVLPGQKLPVQATWFTGMLRVPTGESLTPGLLFNAKFERLDIFDVKNGVVIHHQEKHNASPDDR
jgi:hypothetical protein